MTRITLTLAALLLAASAALAQTNSSADPSIYRLDLSDLNRLDPRDSAQARQAWDTLHVMASVQGIVNRGGPHLFICHMPETDDFWWAYLRDEQGWLRDRPVIEVRVVAELLQRFARQIKGVVLYDEQVRATSNLASTFAASRTAWPCATIRRRNRSTPDSRHCRSFPRT